MLGLLLAAAWAGYGDPIDGVPNQRERATHVWTSAVRVAPEAFAADYPCAFGGFEDVEKEAQVPFWWHDGLGRIAREHSEDQLAMGQRTHQGSDGRGSEARIRDVFSGSYGGENVAEGYDEDPWRVVIEGWMCSDGHRAGIKNPDFQYLGVGVAERFWTQDFGGDDQDPTPHPARMGVHTPPQPTDEAEYLLAVYTGTTDPAAVSVVVDGAPTRMTVAYGTARQGVYRATVPVDTGCTTYWFDVDGALFPEDGAYGFGDCDWDDPEAKWMLRDGPTDTGRTAEDDKGCGCTSGSPPAGWLSLALLGLLTRRRTA